MCRVKKLSAEQSMSLSGLTLKEKLNKLIEWRLNGEASQEQLNYFSDRWIKRAAKKKMCDEAEPQLSSKVRTVIEGDMRKLIGDFRHRINEFVTKRDLTIVKISADEKASVRKYLYRFGYLPQINELLILGLRYPDKELNEICASYIKNCKRSSVFWISLWRDDFVPLDAIRLMLEGNTIAEGFSQSLISKLLPLIKAQQEKEVIRLVWAESSKDGSTARKEGRIVAFNRLIKAAEAYVQKTPKSGQ